MDTTLRKPRERPHHAMDATPHEVMPPREEGAVSGEAAPRPTSQEYSPPDTVSVAIPSAPLKTVVAPAAKILEREIQHILSEDIADLYRELSPQQKAIVAQEGRAATGRIMEILRETKVRLQELVMVLRLWLQKIPGLNRFFIEQEARIKASKILTLKR